MAEHSNDMSILGLGSSGNQNRAALHNAGKRSSLHLAFQNDKVPDVPMKSVEVPKEIPVTKMSFQNLNRPSLNESKAPDTKNDIPKLCLDELVSSSPPPPLPPKMRINSGNFNVIPFNKKTDSFETPSLINELSNSLHKPCKDDLQLCIKNMDIDKRCSDHSLRWNCNPKLEKSFFSKLTSSDVDTTFKDPKLREHKRQQLVLHLPPSGANYHYSTLQRSIHHHNQQRHPNHESRSYRRDKLTRGFYNNIQLSGKLNISPNLQVDFIADDLHDLGEIGRGGFGTVNKMVHRKTNTIMAVKRIRLTVDENEQKQLRDLEVAMWSNDCPYIVQFYGATLKEGDCWICMELMDISLDKFYKFVYENLNEGIPEKILGKITVTTLTALNYLKEKLKLIHRDVKPSNILLDRRGNIKLCDFGISGHLVDSIAKTRDAGCRPYMAPERIDPAQAKGYDVRSDVWSLGITLMELATGSFPYPKWNSVFEQLTQVVQGEPPRLKLTENGNTFTEDFVNFVNTCLTKEESARPKYKLLLDHPFVKKSNEDTVNVAQYVAIILDKIEADGNFMYTYNSYNY